MPETKKIVVVDDELDMRIFIAALLKTGGFQPVVCRNGEEGLKKVRQENPDLIILDVMMPGDGGVKMYRDLKTETGLKDIPVLMLTGVQETSFAHYIRMLRSRIDGPIPDPDAYIEKPPEPAVLLKTVQELLALKT